MSAQKADRIRKFYKGRRSGFLLFLNLFFLGGRLWPPPSLRYYCQVYRLNKEKGEGFPSPSLYPIFDFYAIKLYVLHMI
jgi:hypothetical protein